MDWNEDGKKDLVTGEENGNVRIYLNTNTDADPDFSGYFLLEVAGVIYDAGQYSAPHVVDWNNDGMKDVLVGRGDGRVHLLINTGTNANPAFSFKDMVIDGSKPLDLSGHISPTTVDMNRDGKKDIIGGETLGNLYYFENKGTDANPKFNGKQAIEAVGSGWIDVGSYARLDVVDWDGDNVMDIVCGCGGGTVYYFHALGPLSLDTNQISAGIGGKINLDLRAGAAGAGRTYLILGSVTGTAPGIPLPGGQVTLPVNWDLFTNLTLSLMNTPPFHNFMGVLDGAGKTSAIFDTFGPLAGMAGFTISFAYALNSPWDYASNGANIEIVP